VFIIPICRRRAYIIICYSSIYYIIISIEPRDRSISITSSIRIRLKYDIVCPSHHTSIINHYSQVYYLNCTRCTNMPECLWKSAVYVYIGTSDYLIIAEISIRQYTRCDYIPSESLKKLNVTQVTDEKRRV